MRLACVIDIYGLRLTIYRGLAFAIEASSGFRIAPWRLTAYRIQAPRSLASRFCLRGTWLICTLAYCSTSTHPCALLGSLRSSRTAVAG